MMRCRSQICNFPREKLGSAGKQFSHICATHLGYVEFSLAHLQVLAHLQGCQHTGFSPKFGDFLGL
jgi:hypothetical protein